MLFCHTGTSRQSAAVIEKQINAAVKSEAQAVKAMHALKRAALEMKEALLRGRTLRVLEILGASWEAKKRMADGISNPHIERAARTAT